MFGWHLRMPMNMLIGAIGPVTSDNTTDWVNRHQEQLHYAYQRASDSLQKTKDCTIGWHERLPFCD